MSNDEHPILHSDERKQTDGHRYLVVSNKKIEEFEAMAPDGYKFLRACYSITDRGTGVRVFFAKVVPPPPSIELTDLGKDMILDMHKGREIIACQHVLGGDVDIKFDDGSSYRLAKPIADAVCEYRPARTPTVRLLTLNELKNLPVQLIKSRKTIVDCFLTQDDCRKVFNLGENVEIMGVAGMWEGEPVVGRGKCTGFRLRCRVV